MGHEKFWKELPALCHSFNVFHNFVLQNVCLSNMYKNRGKFNTQCYGTDQSAYFYSFQKYLKESFKNTILEDFTEIKL